MANQVTILGIAGSLRKQSFNKGALRAAQGLVPPGAKLEIFDIAGIPGFNQDEEKSPPPKVIELKSRIRAAGAILLCTPEYNYSIPGVLKNAIDWASRPYGDSAWNGKPVAIMGASVGAFGTMRAHTTCASASCSSTWTPCCSPKWPSPERRINSTLTATSPTASRRS